MNDASRRLFKGGGFGAALAVVVGSGPALAFCDAPVPPQLTSPELAKEYREEFQLEFETYFRDAQDYLRCVDQERSKTIDELEDTTIRYARFLEDAQQWEQLK